MSVSRFAAFSRIFEISRPPGSFVPRLQPGSRENASTPPARARHPGLRPFDEWLVANGSGEPPPAATGSLAIETRPRKVSADALPNTSGNPFVRVPVTLCRVLCEDRPVAVDPSGFDVEEFAAARILDGAPRMAASDWRRAKGRLLRPPRPGARASRFAERSP